MSDEAGSSREQRVDQDPRTSVAGSPSGSVKPDVLVVGGGVIGVCTAYYLARGGAAVTLLEEHQVGGPMASSYGNIGLLVPSHSTPVAEPHVISRGLRWLLNPDSPLYVRPRPDADLVRWLLRFRAACTAERCAAAEPILRRWQMASLELFAELAAELPAEVNFERKGGLFLYREEQSWQEAVATVRAEQEEGIDVAVVEPDELRALVPALLPGVTGAVHYRGDGRVIPDRFVRALAAAAAECGAAIHEHATVFGLERRGRAVHAVHTSLGIMQPRTVVLATGSVSPRLGRDAGLRIPVQPAKGYSITVRRPPSCPDIPLHLHDERVVITPFGPDRMRMGGTLELAGDDRSVNLRRVAAVRRAGIDLDRRLPRHGADAKRSILDRDTAERRDAVEVDQDGGPRQAEVEQRHQALPAGERPRVSAMRGEQGDGVCHLGRALVGERRRLHRPWAPAAFIDSDLIPVGQSALSSPSSSTWSA